eukprot:COSAG06_NODE_2612_length_6582_cov_2.890791_1_plen_66_part_10
MFAASSPVDAMKTPSFSFQSCAPTDSLSSAALATSLQKPAFFVWDMRDVFNLKPVLYRDRLGTNAR